MKPLPFAVLLTLISLLAGCHAPSGSASQTTGPNKRTYPADFSLVLTVQPRAFVGAGDPMRQPSHYVLEPDGTLRVALGPGVHPGLYPPATAVLSAEQVAELYRIVDRGGLMTWSDKESGGGEVVYRVEITAASQTHRYTADPDASPATAALLRRLIALRGG